jgi:hypothetical protein
MASFVFRSYSSLLSLFNFDTKKRNPAIMHRQ